MAKLRIFGMAALALLLILGPTWAAQDSADTTVYWSAGCWITLNVHGPVNLGVIDASSYAIGYLEKTGNTVAVRTNCTDGYTLETEALSTTAPTGFAGDILADFYWWVNSYTGSPLDFVQDTETNFPGLNQKVTVASSSNPATHQFDMGYKYYIDTDDIPGDYSVQIRYTVTSQ